MSRKSKRTQRQIEAARKNGARSKGPVTPAGKARSSQNALKSGLYARAICLVTEDHAEFERFRDNLIAELAPATALELDYAEEFIACRWRIRRVRTAEAVSVDLQMQIREEELQKPGPVSDEVLTAVGFRDLSDHSRCLANYRRLENSLARQAENALRRLEVLQDARLALERQTISEPSAKLPAVCKNKPGGPQLVSNQPAPEEPTPPLPNAA